MKQIARATFTSYNVTVPHQWKTPSGDPDGQQYVDAFKPEERTVAPPAPTLFFPATPNKYHVDTAKKLNADIGGFIDDMCTAICDAWDKWQKAATLVGLVITGPVGLGGNIVGPPMMPLILASAPKAGNFGKYAMIIASEIGMGWDQFILTCKAVPPLALWPMFAAFPSPAAVNIPSAIPMPFASLMQIPITINANILKTKMLGSLADPQAWFAKDLFGAIATAFENCYNLWKTTTMITNVMGSGPVPTMATPVPVPGPVTGGVGVMLPGGFK